ncbi:general substrate transporter [Annulohypoxylon nitens]|nr:general substrate transporter [Annulohypoxylon nitens]
MATIGGMLFGFDISSMSAIIDTEQYMTFFNNPAGIVQGIIGASLALGSIIGSALAGPLSDRIGRRDCIIFACFWWLLGTALQTAVDGTPMLIVGRIFNGVCIGFTSSQVPVYLAEIASKEERGRVVIIQQISIQVGIILMFFMGYGCTFIPGPASFRTAWSLQFIPCVVLLCGLPFLPRSPRWLAKVDRGEEAVHILANIHANGNIDDPLVVAEWEEISQALELERSASKGWRMFVQNGMWRRTLAGFCVQMWQQNAGANVITYYIVYIFKMANLTGNILLVSSGVQYALGLIFTSIMLFYIDKTGRRPLLIGGAIAMALCHFVVGVALSGGEHIPGGIDGNPNVVIRVTGHRAYTVIAFCYLLMVIYAMTLAPVTWIYSAEVWSLETRATGMGIAAIGNWTFNFALGLYIPPGFRNISWGLFIVFGLMCCLAAAQAYFTYPETCNKSLEEIEILFSPGGPRPWNTKPGGSNLDELVTQARDNKYKIDDVKGDELGGRGQHVERVADIGSTPTLN